MKIDIEIEHGAIIINEVDLIIDYPFLKIYYVDLHSKYPGGIAYSIADNEIEVSLWADTNTLRIDPDCNIESDRTVIVFKFGSGSTENWSVMADAARYTVRIIMWNSKVEDPNLYKNLYNRRDENEIKELYAQGLGESLEQMRRGEGVDLDLEGLKREIIETIVKEHGDTGIQCPNHTSSLIYHATKADLEYCILQHRTVSYSPTTDECPERFWYTEDE